MIMMIAVVVVVEFVRALPFEFSAVRSSFSSEDFMKISVFGASTQIWW